MKILISPSFRMREDYIPLPYTEPIYKKEALFLIELLKDKTVEELQCLYKSNYKIAVLNQERLQKLAEGIWDIPAIYTYSGVSYQAMAPNVFTREELSYLNRYVYILSGLFGVLKPLDGILPYRLEIGDFNQEIGNLYSYWEPIVQELLKNEDFIINLTSSAYEKLFRPLVNKSKWFDIRFQPMYEGKRLLRIHEIKKMRGLMVRYLAENQIIEVDEIKKFSGLGYQYNETLSLKNHLVFTKEVEINVLYKD